MLRSITLRHLHLPGLTPYLRVSAIQDRFVRLHLDHKATQLSTPSPGPLLITFQTPPTYTCGRREIGTLSASQIDYLRAGGSAEFHEALRGGQTTYHGPGQLTAYLILSLQEYGFNTRSHIRLLEDSVVGTCQQFGLSTHITENPGVWTGPQPDARKLASVGVHLRRHIASHGIGLNVHADLSWFDRIVACGLVGRKATNLREELFALYEHTDPNVRPNQFSFDDLSYKKDFKDTRKLKRAAETSTNIREMGNVLATKMAVRLCLCLSGVTSHVHRVVEKDLWPGET